MNPVIPIALNTFKEAVRNRILYLILFFSLIMIGSSGVLSQLSISDREKLVKDLGFASISLFGVAIAIFVGGSLVFNELEKKTIYTIVSKPISRWQFLLGKFVGLLITVYVNIIIMTLAFLFILHYQGGAEYTDLSFISLASGSFVKSILTLFTWGSIGAAEASGWWSDYSAVRNVMPVIGATILELGIVTSFAILFSSFSTPFLSMIFTVLTFIAGRMNEDILAFADNLLRKADQTGDPLPLIYYLAEAGALITPNLGIFHRTVEQALYTAEVTIWWQSVLYALCYPAGIICLAMLIFNGRNFK